MRETTKTYYEMEVCDKGEPHTARREPVPERPHFTEDISHHSVMKRAELSVKYWNDTLRSQDKPRELVAIYRTTITEVRIKPDEEKGGGLDTEAARKYGKSLSGVTEALTIENPEGGGGYIVRLVGEGRYGEMIVTEAMIQNAEDPESLLKTTMRFLHTKYINPETRTQ